MKNKQISPGQIPHLVRLTADLFRTMREETKAPSNNLRLQREEADYMHFVVNLLKDLVDTAYPIEEEEIDIENLIEIAQFHSFEEMIDTVAKIAKATKPPKAGEF